MTTEPNIPTPVGKKLTSDSIKRTVEALVMGGKPKKLVVNIGPGAIQSAYVEHKEAVEP